MKLPLILAAILEIIYFLYIYSTTLNDNLKNKVISKKIKIFRKLKINLNPEPLKYTSKIGAVLIFLIFLNFFITTRILITSLIVAFGFLLIKLNISYEKYCEIFKFRNPTKKKYLIFQHIILFSLLFLWLITNFIK